VVTWLNFEAWLPVGVAERLTVKKAGRNRNCQVASAEGPVHAVSSFNRSSRSEVVSGARLVLEVARCEWGAIGQSGFL
jgi:hypothetical protein